MVARNDGNHRNKNTDHVDQIETVGDKPVRVVETKSGEKITAHYGPSANIVTIQSNGDITFVSASIQPSNTTKDSGMTLVPLSDASAQASAAEASDAIKVNSLRLTVEPNGFTTARMSGKYFGNILDPEMTSKIKSAVKDTQFDHKTTPDEMQGLVALAQTIGTTLKNSMYKGVSAEDKAAIIAAADAVRMGTNPHVILPTPEIKR